MNRALAAWYADRRRAYPWRGTRDPYRVLVSEVMLQQTQASRVAPAFASFIERFPDVPALAAAHRSEVVRAWAGLGYNRRAVALSEAARAIVRDHAGQVPRDPKVLERLPGVGPYTAAAVAAFAFGARLPAIDTNVRRVVSRARLGRDDAGVEAVSSAARRWVSRSDPAAWNQAVMDVGREHCRPRPRCEGCPLSRGCAFRRSGSRPARANRPQEPFVGSSRQIRGAVVATLREGPARVGTLATAAGVPPRALGPHLAALVRDGLITAGPAALSGRPEGRAALR